MGETDVSAAPFRGCSSVGRALALQAGGRRFEPDQFHNERTYLSPKPLLTRPCEVGTPFIGCVALVEPGWQRPCVVRDALLSDNMEDKDCASNPDVEHMMD